MTAFTTTRDNISYHMMPDYRESYAEGHFTREQVCLVDWNLKDNFLSAILPQVRIDDTVEIEDLALHVYGAPAGKRATSKRLKLERKNPQVHPNDETMFAADYEVLQGVGYPVKDSDSQFAFKTLTGSGLSTTYGKSLIKVVWKTLPYRVDISDAATNAIGASELIRYCSVKTSYAGQNLEIPPGRTPLEMTNINGTRFAPPRPLPFNIRRPFSEVHVMITWHYVPVVPNAARFYQGRVNETAVTNPSPVYRGTFRRGCLLYLNPEVSEEYYTFGDSSGARRVVNITYHFLWRDNDIDAGNEASLGHNFMFSPAEGRMLRVCRGVFVGGNLTFPIGDVPWPTNRPFGAAGLREGGNIHDYVEMHNLFRVDAATVQYT
jgi:hypothetical protein